MKEPDRQADRQTEFVNLTIQLAEAVVIQGQLLQQSAVVQTLHPAQLVVVEGSPAQVHQLVQVSETRQALTIEIQRRDLGERRRRMCPSYWNHS